jgi:hypothetical protein
VHLKRNVFSAGKLDHRLGHSWHPFANALLGKRFPASIGYSATHQSIERLAERPIPRGGLRAGSRGVQRPRLPCRRTGVPALWPLALSPGEDKTECPGRLPVHRPSPRERLGRRPRLVVTFSAGGLALVEDTFPVNPKNRRQSLKHTRIAADLVASHVGLAAPVGGDPLAAAP